MVVVENTTSFCASAPGCAIADGLGSSAAYGLGGIAGTATDASALKRKLAMDRGADVTQFLCSGGECFENVGKEYVYNPFEFSRANTLADHHCHFCLLFLHHNSISCRVCRIDPFMWFFLQRIVPHTHFSLTRCTRVETQVTFGVAELTQDACNTLASALLDIPGVYAEDVFVECGCGPLPPSAPPPHVPRERGPIACGAVVTGSTVGGTHLNTSASNPSAEHMYVAHFGALFFSIDLSSYLSMFFPL